MWQQVARRPVRPMSTVVLDSNEKHSVLSDVNDYLHPRTPRWYASRGIPLRRGYLFHGPPGTGKTSFSFALAGVFGIDIYVISLQDVNVTEEDLATLFTRLPRRCIVLLEDIDTAGLSRDTDDTETEDADDADDDDDQAPLTNGVQKVDGKAKQDKDKRKKKKKKKGKKDSKGDDEKKKGGSVASNSTDDDGTDSSSDSNSASPSDSDSDSDFDSKKKSSSRRKTRVKKARKSRRGKARGGIGSQHLANGNAKLARLDSISLSGLLNAIDGVASHEGRILIMTTNKPESLDEALIRPGRVDVQVAFKNASSTQAAELFRRMYEASRPRRRGLDGSLAQPTLPPSPPLPTHQDKSSGTKTTALSDELDVSGEEELEAIAQEFGRWIPEEMFSPAEIQGFLLKRKHRPRKALEDVEGWVAAAVKQKEANSKVSTVQ